MSHQDSNAGFITRAQGRRESRFPQKDTLSSGSNFTFWEHGVNYSIPYLDFLAELGVTGVLQQAGEVTALPVLDIQGSDNFIRNILPSVGLKGNITPENGIGIQTDLLPSSGGIQVLFNELTAPQFRGLAAGTGISLQLNGDNIEINNASIPTGSKTVIVDTIDDFPFPVGGVITLEDETEYFLVNDILSTDSFVMGNNSAISAGEPTTVTLTYTGTDPMFTSMGATSRILSISLSCANADLLDITGQTFSMSSCLVAACQNIGTVTNTQIFQIRNSFIVDAAAGGITCVGANSLFVLDTIYAVVGGGTIVDLGVTTFDDLSILNCIWDMPSGGTFLSGAAGSANINVGRTGVASNNRLIDVTTPLTGITPDDDRWGFNFNDAIRDTNRIALITLNGNATATVLSVLDLPVLVAGVWVEQNISGYTSDVNGRLTYTNEKPRDTGVAATFTAQKATGGGVDDYTFLLFVNGIGELPSVAKGSLSSTAVSQITVNWNVELVEGDFLEIFVAGNTSTDDVLIVDAQFRLS